jgi:tape measure domain-containing protein
MEHYAKSIGYATQQMKDRDKFSLRRKASGEMFDASRTGAQRLDRSIDRVDALERIGGGSGGLSGGQATAVRQNLLNKELGYRSAANAAAEYARMERIVGDMVMRGQYSITDATRAMRQYATAIGHVTAEQRLRNREERHRTSAKEIIDETRTAVDKYRRSIAELNAMLRRGNIDQRTHARGVRDARNRYASESQQNPNFWQRVQRSMVPDKHLQAIGTFGLPMAVGAGIKKAFDLTANLQVAEKSFEVMTNSSGAAKRLIGDMRALDRASLLNFQSITKAGQTMMGFGVETSDVMPIMTSLSDISMGNSERMEKLSLAMGQVRASGKLAGTELLQLINAGFNPLQEIARTTGKSMPELLQAMHDKKISWEQVKDAVQSATAEGGRFFNMTKELEKTAAGSMAKFVSDLQIIGMDIGERIVPGLTKMMEIFNGIPGSPGGSFFSWLAGQSFDGLGYLAAGMKDIASGDMSFGGVGKAMEEAQYRELERIEKLKDGLAQSSSDMFLKSIKSELEKQKMTMEQYADVFSSNSGMQEKLKFQFQEIFGLEKGYRAFQMFAEQMKQLDSDAKERQAKEQLQIVSDNDKKAFDRLGELQKEKAKLLEKEETLADKIAALRKMEKDLQMSAEGKQNIQKSIDLLREIDRIEKKKEANQKRLEQQVGFQQEDTVLRAISARARQGVGIENTTTSLGEWATFATKQSFDAVRQEMIQSLGNRRLANEAFAKFKEAAELAKQQYKDQQKQDAKDIFMSQLSSQEKAAVRFAKLSKLLDDKLITQQEFDKEKASLEQQVFEETWGNGAVMVPALRAGTVEAYKYLAESKQRDEEKKIFQKQLDLQKTSKDLLQKIADREFGIE